jgi:putative transposase
MEGTYLVTICAVGRRHIFGFVENDHLVPTRLGSIVAESWTEAVRDSPSALEHAFALMPNHLHFVTSLMPRRGSSDRHGIDGLAHFVRGFKARATAGARAAGLETPIWQRGYHESVLEGDDQYADAVFYVQQNPKNWHRDPDR